MPVSLTDMVRTTSPGPKSGPRQSRAVASTAAASPAPGPRQSTAAPPARRPKSGLIRVTVLLHEDDLARADEIAPKNGFNSRHHLLQWLILYGLKGLEKETIKPQRQLSRVVEVLRP